MPSVAGVLQRGVSNQIPTPTNRPLVVTWNTATASSLTMQFVVNPMSDLEGNYSYTIDWGDGTVTAPISTYNDAALSHTYSGSGIKTITFQQSNSTDPIPCFNSLSGGSWSQLGLWTIESWGDFPFATCKQMFYVCTNLTYNVVDGTVPNFSKLYRQAGAPWANKHQVEQMFVACFALDLDDVSGWDFSNLEDIDGIFDRCTSAELQNISNDWSSVNSHIDAFGDIDSAIWDPSNLDFRTATQGGGLFKSNVIATLDGAMDGANWEALGSLGSGMQTNHMFYQTTGSFPNIDTSGWDMSNIIASQQMFESFTAGDVVAANWDMSSNLSFLNMFAGYTGIDVDVSNWTLNAAGGINAQGMFAYSTNCDPDFTTWDLDLFSNFNDVGLSATGLTSAQYAANLIAWDAAGFSNTKTIRFNTTYGSGGTARANLITAGWSITDNGP